MSQPSAELPQLQEQSASQGGATSDEELTDVVDGSGSDDEQESDPLGAAAGGQGAAGAGGMAAALAAAGNDWAAATAVAEGYVAAGKFEKAVNEYSSLLRRSSIAGGAGADPAARARHAELLLARCAAWSALSEQLRSIPAAQSESRAIYAPDPTQLAALGLKDADAALALQPGCPLQEAQLQRGRCLALLERYGEAEAALRAGLEAQPTHAELLAALQRLQALLADGGGGDGAAPSSGGAGAAASEQPGSARRLRVTADDAECTICAKLLYEPVTTPCGHSFCRPCFSRAMDHGNKCPMCRRVLHVGRELAVTVVLKELLELSFPEEYEQRRVEERGAGAGAAPAAGDAPLPLFVMSLLLPGETLALNIFEPRYRLMVRRCMEGSRCFGMGTVNRQHQLADVACEAEITECNPLPDGRYYIEVVGRRRFRPAETWEQDGYRMARPEYLQDEAPPEGGPDAAALAEAAAEVEALADAFVEKLRSLAQTRRGVLELLHRAGEKPAGGSPESLSFWAASLVCSVLADEAGLKHTFLSGRSTLERLQAERQLLQQLGGQQTQGCTLM